ncbi:hypothetical protein GCM10009808_02300 [Microbacterium sediminicola]|uniref:PTS EIIB type-3 domain-containing protein n=1 Tax=Microbacterium sediminicola TaxID=415210 RepID=A0ABP4TK10_9MICO
MRILVMCGAGASSTFVAQRLRAAAAAAGREFSVRAGTPDTLERATETVDLVLVGPHLDDRFPELAGSARARGSLVALLPSDVFEDRDGTRTLALVDDAIDAAAVESSG